MNSPFDASTIVIRDDLSLRPIRRDDADTILRLLTEGDLARETRFVPVESTLAATEAWILQLNTPDRLSWAIVEAERGILYGVAQLRLTWENASAETRLWIGKPFRGQSHGTDALRALVRLAFEEMGLHRLSIEHRMEVSAAAALCERIGFLPEGVRRNAEKTANNFADLAQYGLLRTDDY